MSRKAVQVIETMQAREWDFWRWSMSRQLLPRCPDTNYWCT